MEPNPRPAPRSSDRPDPPAPADGSDDASQDAPASIRAARLALIREQIAAGAYDTPDRLDAALGGLLSDLLD